MATVRQITWKNKDGKTSKRFELSYLDRDGLRHRKLYALKRQADDKRIQIENEMVEGTHVPARFSKTLKEACTAFLAHKEALVKVEKIERSTVRRYRTHVERHINEHVISKILLSDLRPSDIQDFVDHLMQTKSTALSRKIFYTLCMTLNFCRLRQMLVTNPADVVRLEKPRDRSNEEAKIPPKESVKALLAASDSDETGRDGAMVRLMAIYGLRSSEVRGAGRQFFITRKDGSAELTIGQRADEYGKIGRPKTQKSRRTLIIAPDTVVFVKKAMLARKAGEQNLIFPNEIGNPIDLSKFMNRWWPRLMQRAGLAKRITHDNKGKKLNRRKIEVSFTPHQLRHVAASMRIEMGWNQKELQEFMGHTSLKMTMDTYGHLWRSDKKLLDSAKEAERFFG